MSITPYVFEDQMVRAMQRDGQPWFIGKDVCRALELSNTSQAIDRLDDDEKGITTNDTLGGEQSMIIVSEAGVYRLIFTSRKPSAERFKRWLAHEVLPAIRQNGFYGRPARHVEDVDGNRVDINAEAVPVLTTKLALVREARHLWGHERARAIWKQLGLAVPVDDHSTGTPEARQVLALIMAGEHEGHSLGHLTRSAMDGDEATSQMLRMAGILCLPDEDCFVIANRHPVLARVLQGTGYERFQWAAVLRRLPGATPGKVRAWPGQPTARGITIPMTAMDFAMADA